MNKEMEYENFNEKNIEITRKMLNQENGNDFLVKRAYTLVQRNSPCKVNVTKENRTACVKSLLG